MSSHASLEPGARIGKYVLRERIGNGATAHVYEAQHEALGHVVAIKVLRRVMVAKIQGRFDRETRALASIHSRHVPQVHDVGTLEDGTPYVVMERLRGETLAEHIQGRGRLSVEETLDLGAQLAAALEATHEAGWVHRDVKPCNLVLHEESDGRRVLKLCDFGVCTPREREQNPRLTLDGQTVGTPEHMSPEQARGLPLDPRSDVFAIGTVLHEMLIGYSPFERPGTSPHVVALAVTREPVRSLRDERSDVSPALDALILKTLEKEPDGRPSSATALRQALEGIVTEGIPEERAAPRGTRREDAGAPRRRARTSGTPGWARTGLAAAAAAAVALLTFAWADVDASAPFEEARAPFETDADALDDSASSQRAPTAAEIAVANLRPPPVWTPRRASPPTLESEPVDEVVASMEDEDALSDAEDADRSARTHRASRRRRASTSRRDPAPADEGVSLTEVHAAIDRALERNPRLGEGRARAPRASTHGAAARLGSPRRVEVPESPYSAPAVPAVTVPASPYRPGADADRRVADARPVPGNPF